MASDSWPDSRARLLEDIDKFSQQGAPKVADPVQPPKPPQPASPQPSAAPPIAAAVAVPPPPAATVAAPPPLQLTPAPALNHAAPPAAASSVLAKLKQQALEKQQSENRKTAQQDEVLQRIHQALGMTYQYLNDLVQQLNILKPPYAKAYSFFGLADFDELTWQEGRADFRMRETASENRLYNQVTLRYRLAGPKQFRLVRENPALEKLRKALFDYNIAFTADEIRNERGLIERATFTFPCEIKAGLMLAGNYETGRLLLRTRHVERFGIMEYEVPPESITQDALDEIAQLILGESNRVNQLFHRTV